MNWFAAASKRDKTIVIVSGINLLFSILYLYILIQGYFNYQLMPGALNSESFLYMAAFQLIIITGLGFMLFGNKKGFYIYLAGQLLSYIYPFVSGTIDTVWGLLTLPLLITPLLFGIYYYRNLHKLS